MALLQGGDDLGFPHFHVPKFVKKYGKYAAGFAVGGPAGAAALAALRNRKKMGRILLRKKGGR